MNHIVEANWLAEHLNDDVVRVIDCRFELSDPSWGQAQYEKEHIPNALYFDLNQDLSSPVQQHGGRHPLPNIEVFAEKLSEAGIDENTTVVAYDDDGAMASRFWWLLTYLGHPKAYVLNGGFKQWKNLGYEVTKDVPIFTRKHFAAYPHNDYVVSMKEVQKRIDQGNACTLIDSRDPNRYKGLTETVDKKAGHIPTAVNYFWKDGFTEKGTFLSKEEQTARFQFLDKNKEIIVYCGSGVTACPNVLALREAGFTNVKLYAGSWSDWISYDENEIVTANHSS